MIQFSYSLCSKCLPFACTCMCSQTCHCPYSSVSYVLIRVAPLFNTLVFQVATVKNLVIG